MRPAVQAEAGPRGPLWFDDLEVGLRFSTGRRTVTESDVVQFAGLSGDFNPLHVDAVFAAGTEFGRTIAHGALVLSMATGLRQQSRLFEGTLKALLEIRSWKFVRPVFPGDTICATTTIRELRRSRSGAQGVAVQEVEVLNEAGHVVQAGELVGLVRARA